MTKQQLHIMHVLLGFLALSIVACKTDTEITIYDLKSKDYYNMEYPYKTTRKPRYYIGH